MKNTSSNLLEKIWNNRYQNQTKTVNEMADTVTKIGNVINQPEESNGQGTMLTNDPYAKTPV